MLYLSPNWKFIISTELLADESLLPPNCPIITAEKFLSVNEKLVFLLERRLKPHFRAYSECYALAKNWCVNNFDKIFKMRIKIESEYILNDFLSMIEYFIGSINPKYF